MALRGAEVTESLEAEFQQALGRGSEALSRGQLEAAADALEDALAIRSRDPQVLALLGQAFYRLGRYDDAAIAWQRLVDDNPVEPGARVNLGLAWLKARHFEDAAQQLKIALDLNGEHRKAAGYLGLALLELGRTGEARGWFARAGSDQMVARCDELLAMAAGATVAEPAEPEAPPPGEEEAAAEVPPQPEYLAEPEAAAGHGASDDEVAVPLPEPEPEAAAAAEPEPEPEPEPEQEQEQEPVPEMEAEAAPLPGPASAPVPTAASLPTLAGWSASRVVSGPGGQVFVADGASLTVNVHGELLCRLAGLAAWRGELAFAGEVKRFRGRATDQPFGEPPEQMHRLVGDGLVVVRAAGRRFTVLELGGEAGYFRESVVFGFQEQVAFENGRLPSASGGLDLVHLRGRGRLVLVTRGEPVAVEVTSESPVHVPIGSLVGWTGALTPRIAPLFAGGGDGTAVELSGEGRVLVDPGPAARSGDAA